MGEHEYHVSGDAFSGWTHHCKCGEVSICFGTASQALAMAARHAMNVEIGMAA